MSDISVFGITIPSDRVAAFSERNYKEFMAYLFGCIDVEIEQVRTILIESLWLSEVGFQKLFQSLKDRVKEQKRRYNLWNFDDDFNIDDDFDDDFEKAIIERFTKWVEVYDFPDPDELEVFVRIFDVSYDFYISIFQETEANDDDNRSYFYDDEPFPSLFNHLFPEMNSYDNVSRYYYGKNNNQQDSAPSGCTFLPVSGHEYYLGIDITKLAHLNSEEGKQLIGELFLKFSLPPQEVIEVLEQEHLCKRISMVMNRFDCQIGAPGRASATSILQGFKDQTDKLSTVIDMKSVSLNSKELESLSANEQLARMIVIVNRISEWSLYTAAFDDQQLENLLHIIDVQLGDLLCVGYLLFDFGFVYAIGIEPNHVIQFLRRFHEFLDEDKIDTLLELYTEIKPL